jgi:hypothetical protein
MLMLERGAACEECGRALAGHDAIAHHVKELTAENMHDAGVSLDPGNLLLVCHRCHNAIHGRFGGGRQRQVWVVWGSPGAGKTTLVQGAANADDLVIDMDRLWDAVCTAGAASKPPRCQSDVFALRDLLRDRVRTRAGKWRQAWWIEGLPRRSERLRVIRELGAEGIHVATGEAECLGRIGSDERRAAWCRDWWRDFQPDAPPAGGR